MTEPAEQGLGEHLELGKLLRFVIVGGVTALIYIGLLYLLLSRMEYSYVLSSSSAHFVALLFNYIMHYSWTFDVDHPHGQVSARYLVMHAGSFLLNLAVIWLGADVLGYNFLLVQGVSILLILAWNFSLSALWVYRSA